MTGTPSPPLFLRLSPGAWTALVWGASLVYAFLVDLPLPGEADAGRPPRWPPGFDEAQWWFIAAATLLALGGAALLRRAPVPALVAQLVAAVLAAMALHSTVIALPEFLATAIAIAFVAAYRSRRVSAAAAVLAAAVPAGYVVVRLLLAFPVDMSTELILVLTVVIAWLAGITLRQGAERSRMANAQAMTAERLRIARDLHDGVAHSLGIIAIQSGAARMVLDTQPERAREALGAVETASRETLAGLRTMLGALRDVDDGSAEDGIPVAGLADLPRLVTSSTAAGVSVDVRRRGPLAPLPAEIDQAAFRVIQEAVTNVVRHAGADRCAVTIEHRDGELAVEIVDSGQGAAGRNGAGYGITGMRERVTLLSGEFSAGTRPEGGFRVAVRLPVREDVP